MQYISTTSLHYGNRKECSTSVLQHPTLASKWQCYCSPLLPLLTCISYRKLR